VSEQTDFEARQNEEAAINRRIASEEMMRPSAIFRPSLAPDGDQWRALYGSDLMEGVSGFGPTPDAAMRDFDSQWMTQRTPAALALARGEVE